MYMILQLYMSFDTNGHDSIAVDCMDIHCTWYGHYISQNSSTTVPVWATYTIIYINFMNNTECRYTKAI